MDQKPQDLKDNLISKEEEPVVAPKEEPEPHIARQAWDIFYMSIFPTITMVFHPMYQVVNSVYLGQIDGATQLQASFGLASMLINIFMQSIAISFGLNVSTFIG
jgi:Na+-driven multidrug efflux pump